jgi:hypothetical protein
MLKQVVSVVTGVLYMFDQLKKYIAHDLTISLECPLPLMKCLQLDIALVSSRQ